MANEKLTPPGGWNPHLVSSITSLTGSRLAPQPPDEQPRLLWQTPFGKTDLELRRGAQQFTLWLNADVYRSEKDMRALRDLARQHNLTYLLSGDTDENL